MGIRTKGSINNWLEDHSQPSPVTSLRCGPALEEVKKKYWESGESIGRMNLDELLKSAWSAEANRLTGMDKTGDATPSSSSAHRHSGSTLPRAMSAKTIDELWKEIKQGNSKGIESGDPKLEEITLEDFLLQAGLPRETSRSPSVGLDHSTEEGSPRDYTPPIGLSPAPSIGSLSDVATLTRRKRGDPEAYEKAIERRLRRKIKNRESAARSRARKQAYQNELVTKVSLLEEENIRLKKEKEFDAKFPFESSARTKYQLRRTGSASL